MLRNLQVELNGSDLFKNAFYAACMIHLLSLTILDCRFSSTTCQNHTSVLFLELGVVTFCELSFLHFVPPTPQEVLITLTHCADLRSYEP
jgi:hypothetical protein